MQATTNRDYTADGKTIRALRLRKMHWTQEQLAKAAGLQTGTVSRIETGYHHPQLGTILKVADVLDVDVDDLVGWHI